MATADPPVAEPAPPSPVPSDGTGPKPLVAFDLFRLGGQVLDATTAEFTNGVLALRRSTEGWEGTFVPTPAVTLPDAFVLKALGRVSGGAADEWKVILAPGAGQYDLNVTAGGGSNCILNRSVGASPAGSGTGRPPHSRPAGSTN